MSKVLFASIILVTSGCSGSVTPVEGATAAGAGTVAGFRGGLMLIGGILAAPFGADAVESTMGAIDSSTKPATRVTDGAFNLLLEIDGSDIRVVDGRRFEELARNPNNTQMPLDSSLAERIERQTGRKPLGDFALVDSQTGEVIVQAS